MSTEPAFTAASVNAKLEQKVAALFADHKFTAEFDAFLSKTVEAFPCAIDCGTDGLVELLGEHGISHAILDTWFQGGKAGLEHFAKFFDARGVRLVVRAHLKEWHLYDKSATSASSESESATLFAAFLKSCCKTDGDSEAKSE